MRKVILGRTKASVSAISLGTWAFGGENKSGKKSVGWANQNDDDSYSTLLKAWSEGINHWDTADVYGDCLLYTSPSPRDLAQSRMPSSA